MPSILNLKFKGNKSFVAFSNLNDTEALTKTWKVCTKVASYLEQGQRLENLSWRLWHLQNLMVDTDNAKSKREFKKLSKCMGDKLDKEKGRSIEELEAPDFRRTSSSDMIRQRAAEKERYREQVSKPGTIKRMQFTFSIDQPPSPGASFPVKKPDLKPSPEFTKRTRAAARAQADEASGSPSNYPSQIAATASPVLPTDDMIVDSLPELPHLSSSTASQSRSHVSQSSQSLKFDSIFNQGFGPSALLFPAPTLTTSMNYGEGLDPSHASNDPFTISRPTIELPLDEILNNVDSPASPVSEHQDIDFQSAPSPQLHAQPHQPRHQLSSPQQPASLPQVQMQSQQDIIMRSVAPATTTVATTKRRTRKSSVATRDDGDSDEETNEHIGTTFVLKNVSTLSQAVKETILPDTVAPSKLNPLFTTTAVTRTNLSTRPTLTVKTQTASRTSGPGATATSLTSTSLRSGNSAPGGVKAECSNCGATHTPLWRRGLNDELNCNACGLYCKLHKRPRPKSMRNNHGEGRTQTTPRQDPVDVMGECTSIGSTRGRSTSTSVPVAQTAQCYNCHTTATPLWRKDDEGKTVCNACGLYYKLHGSARPISMKSDVIRKRSRHDARRGSNAGATSIEDTPSASPDESQHASPARDPSPTLAPDSTTTLSYDYTQDHLADAFGTQSELVGALGQDQGTANLFQNTFQFQFPGPYHPDYLLQMYTAHAQAAAAATGVSSDGLSGFGSPSVGVVEIPATSSSGRSVGSGASSSSSHTGHSPVSDMDLASMSPRSTKRRRLSTDSASEPPSSAVSSFSFSDGYSPSSSATSLSSRSSMEFPFSSYANCTTNASSSGAVGGSTSPVGPALRGSGNTFWHPPMMPQNDEHTSSPHLGYPSAMLPPVSTTSSSGGKNLAGIGSGAGGVGGVGGPGGGGGGPGCGNGGVRIDAERMGSEQHDHHTGNEDTPMDYLHPPMSLTGVVSDDDSLFSAYLHPPMTMQEDGPGGSAIVA